MCVSVASGIQHAMRMLDTVMSTWPAASVQNFSALFYRWYDLQENVIEHKMCVVIFAKRFVRNISHSKKKTNERNVIKNVYIVLRVKCPFFVSSFNEN